VVEVPYNNRYVLPDGLGTLAMRSAFLVLCLPTILIAAEPNSKDPTWWSSRPLVRSEIPSAIKDKLSNPIDVFIAAKLQEKSLKASEEGDRRTLIRRLSFDLHGLPPTPEEIDQFINDRSENAYEKLVDRLLKSPCYGERWARHWLDVVPYADTHGYDKDKRRDHAWPYRDYVIAAFNQDKPYDRFIQEQLAGDILFPNDREALIGTAFIASGPWDFVGHVELREGTVEKDKTRLLDRDDMIANTFSTFQSLTVHCARCHNHKFDPIPQKDYYRLQAIFAGVERGNRTIPSPTINKQTASLKTKRDQIVARQKEIEESIRKLVSPELTKLDTELQNLQKTLEKLPIPPNGGRSPSNGYHSAIHPKHDEICWVQVDLGKSKPLDSIRLYPARPVDFPDSSGFGFPIRWKLEINDDGDFKTNVVMLANHLEKDFLNPKDEPLLIQANNHKARFVRLTATKLWKRTNDYIFALAEMEIESNGKNIARSGIVTASGSIEAGLWSTKYLVDGCTSRIRLPDRNDPKIGAQLKEREQASLQLRTLENHRLTLLDQLMGKKVLEERRELAKSLIAIDRQLAAMPPGDLVYAPIPQSKPREIHLLRRGDVTQKKELSIPGGLSCVKTISSEFDLKDPNNEGLRRAALANWITNRDNPLTWRSIANRIWHYHFGRGIVDTPNDFGKNGSLPSHPELLDWLACEIREHQSIKKLHKLIVMSKTYRQTSSHHEANAKMDSENRYLWRMNRSRIDAESLRDSVLMISGKMDWKMGGPGYELFRFQDDHSPTYDHSDTSKGNRPEAWRRTIYRFTVRSVPNPFLDCLDGADPNTNTPKRNQTLTALQALAMMNDAFTIQQAGYFAERLQKQSKDFQKQIDEMFRHALGRLPNKDEKQAFEEYVKAHGLEKACRLIWNLNEFVFVD
jgi:hypothetical protein